MLTYLEEKRRRISQFADYLRLIGLPCRFAAFRQGCGIRQRAV